MPSFYSGISEDQPSEVDKLKYESTPATGWDSAGLAIKEGFTNTQSSINLWIKDGSPQLTAEQANAMDVDGLVNFDRPVSKMFAESMIDKKREQLQSAKIKEAANAPIAEFVGELIGGILDPYMLPLILMPTTELTVLGRSARASLEARSAAIAAGQAAKMTAVEAIATKTALGAAEGAIGMAAYQPVEAYFRKEQFDEYNLNTFISNVAFGTALGAGIGGATGIIREGLSRLFNNKEHAQISRSFNDALLNEKKIDLDTVISSQPSAIELQASIGRRLTPDEMHQYVMSELKDVPTIFDEIKKSEISTFESIPENQKEAIASINKTTQTVFDAIKMIRDGIDGLDSLRVIEKELTIPKIKTALSELSRVSKLLESTHDFTKPFTDIHNWVLDMRDTLSNTLKVVKERDDFKAVLRAEAFDKIKNSLNKDIQGPTFKPADKPKTNAEKHTSQPNKMAQERAQAKEMADLVDESIDKKIEKATSEEAKASLMEMKDVETKIKTVESAMDKLATCIFGEIK